MRSDVGTETLGRVDAESDEKKEEKQESLG